MIHRKLTSPRRSGVAAVEAAVCMPAVFAILIGLMEGGRLVEAQQVLNNAAREAGRAVASGRTQDSAGNTIPLTYPQTVAQNYVGNAGFPSVRVTTTLTNKTGAADWQNCNQLDRWEVIVTMPFDDVRWVFVDLFDTNWGKYQKLATTLSATSDWYSMRNIPIVVTSDTAHN